MYVRSICIGKSNSFVKLSQLSKSRSRYEPISYVLLYPYCSKLSSDRFQPPNPFFFFFLGK